MIGTIEYVYLVASFLSIGDASVGSVAFLSVPVENIADQLVFVLFVLVSLLFLHEEHNFIVALRREDSSPEGMKASVVPMVSQLLAVPH